ASDQRVEHREGTFGLLEHLSTNGTEEALRVLPDVEPEHEPIRVEAVRELNVREAAARRAVERHPQVVVTAARAEIVLEEAAEHVPLGLEREPVREHPVQHEV